MNLVNYPYLNVKELIVGHNVTIEPNVEINCNRLVLGDGVVIKSGTKINMTDLVIGDYTVIYDNCFLGGTDWCSIGHNCWFGHYTIIDSIGTTHIGNNVGVGAHSQLWTHAYFGDVAEGCQFASKKQLVVEEDVWFVGHCIVSPIKAKRRSMAMVGSVVTKDMEENHVYGGVPAKDVTDKMGPQFKEVTINDKRTRMENYLKDFLETYKPSDNRIQIVEHINHEEKSKSQFSLTERTYTKNLFPEEIQFMKYLLPDKAKFLPCEENDWIRHHISSNPNKMGF